MISSVATGGAGLSAYVPASTSASTRSASAQAATPGHQTPVTPAEAGFGSLTAADWQLVSASVGKNVGPDASGKIQPLQPLLAGAIQMERRQGTLASGQELTVGDLQGLATRQTSPGLLEQIKNAISYLQSPFASSSGRLLDVTA
jgi:hypothetical protein